MLNSTRNRRDLMDEKLRSAERAALIGGKTEKIAHSNLKRRLGYLEVRENLRNVVPMDSYLSMEKLIEPLFNKENLYHDYSFRLRSGNKSLTLIAHRMESEEEYTVRKEAEELERKQADIDKQIQELQAQKKALKTKPIPAKPKKVSKSREEEQSIIDSSRISMAQPSTPSSSSYLDYLKADEKRRRR